VLEDLKCPNLPLFGRTSNCYGRRWDWEERVEGSGGDGRATVPAVLQYPAGTVHVREAEGQAARAVRCAGNAGRGASPTAGKREKVFPSNLLLD
jgi:hypothetical protein